MKPEILVLKEVYGDENYRATHRGRSGGFYHIFLMPERRGRISVSAFYLDYRGYPTSAGSYKAEKVDGTPNDPRRFLELPDLDNIYTANLFANIQGEGIGPALTHLFVNEMKTQGGVHVASFTPLGERHIKPRLLKRGYKPLEIRSLAQMPYWARETTGWLFRHYPTNRQNY